MRSRCAEVLAVLVLAAGTPVMAQAPGPKPPAAPTLSASEEALAKAFVDALNGDNAARAAWLTANLTSTPSRPAAEILAVLNALHPKEGAVTFERVQRTPQSLLLRVRTPKGDSARIDLLLDDKDPSRISDIGLTLRMPSIYPKKPLAVETPAQLTAAIAERVKFAVDKDEFSGAVLVMKGDEVVFQGAYGLAERDFATPNTLDTRFHLGSMDKQFTALSIGQLIEQGRLSLDTRLIEVLPDYPNPDAARKVTIRHLLTHTAGLGMLWDRKGYDRLKAYERVEELLPAFAAEPLNFEPGTSAAYSNEGFLVLGAVIEKLSGVSWYDYVAKNIFARAGMTHTGYPRIDEVFPGRAVGYRIGGSGLAPGGSLDDPLGYGPRRPNWDFLGYRGNSCGGGYSTVRDMVAFLNALRAGRIVSPKMAETLTALYPQGIGSYGMGFQNRNVDGGRTLRGHDGGGPQSGVNSDAKIVWETGYAYAVLGNYDAPFAQTLGGGIGAILAVQP